MNETVVDKIKSFQLRITTSKANLENDKKVQSFIRLLIEYPEAWSVIYQWRRHPKPLVIVEPTDFNFAKLRADLLRVVATSHYLRNYVYSFFEQYVDFELDNDRIKRINYFLKASRDRSFFESKNEYLLYCSQCGKTVLVNKLDEKDKCGCGLSYDFKFSLTSVPSSISEEIISGHLLELYTLHVAKSIESLYLIGMSLESAKTKVAYTSIEYSDIGVGDKSNGELDLLCLKDNILVAFECKLNETTYNDIKDFLGVSDNLFFKVRDTAPNLKLRKIIITYDGSKLSQLNGYFVMSIKNLISTNDMVKEIKSLLH